MNVPLWWTCLPRQKTSDSKEQHHRYLPAPYHTGSKSSQAPAGIRVVGSSCYRRVIAIADDVECSECMAWKYQEYRYSTYRNTSRAGHLQIWSKASSPLPFSALFRLDRTPIPRMHRRSGLDRRHPSSASVQSTCAHRRRRHRGTRLESLVEECDPTNQVEETTFAKVVVFLERDERCPDVWDSKWESPALQSSINHDRKDEMQLSMEPLFKMSTRWHKVRQLVE